MITKIIINRILFVGVVSCGLAAGLSSCKSGDQDFPDFESQTCYFAKQYPVRTVELGNDLYVDLTRDNQHKVQIQATMGGAYSNPRDITIDFGIDASLCGGVTFADGTDVTPMPESYYRLLGNTIVIPKGDPVGGVEVQLEDAFFDDPLSVTNHYVIPVRMIKATGVDSILSEKNFVLYAVKYVNRYHAEYLINGDLQGATAFVTTKGLNTSLMNYAAKDASGKAYNCELQLNFDNSGNCTVSTNTDGFTASGSGRFVEADESQLVGNRHPDTLYLDFQVSNDGLGISVSEKYVLTVKTRGVKSETFK